MHPPAYPMPIPHRGLTQAAPENTMEAIQAAAECGFRAVEVDIRMSGDGEIVVIHDADLTRLTLGHPSKASTGIVADMTWQALSQAELPYANHLLLDFPAGGFPDEFMAINPYRLLGQDERHLYARELQADPRMAKIPLFKDLARWVKHDAPDGFLLEIEFKVPHMVRKMDEIVRRADIADNCIFFSGSWAHNEEIQQFYRTSAKPTGLKLGANIRKLTPKAKEWLEGKDVDEVGLDAWRFSLEDVAYLSDRGIRVFSNLGDTPDWWAKLRTMPIAGFKTNFAERASRCLMTGHMDLF